jgi:hypothetical protein
MRYHLSDLFLFFVIHFKQFGAQILNCLLQGPELHSELLLDFKGVALVSSLIDSRMPYRDKISLGKLFANEIDNLELNHVYTAHTSWLLYCAPTTVYLSFPALGLSIASTWAIAISRTSTNNGV